MGEMSLDTEKLFSNAETTQCLLLSFVVIRSYSEVENVTFVFNPQKG